MEKGTNTYAALDHVCDLIEKNSDSELTALFVITDGEPRDDDNQRMVERVLDRVENIFDYVFPIAIGRDFEANTAYGQQARQNMREIQGRVTSDPIFLKDYQQVAEKVVQEYRIVDRDNPMRRKKRTFISENKPVVEFLKNVYPSMERYGRRKKQNPFKRWT